MKSFIIYIFVGFFLVILAGICEVKYLTNLSNELISEINIIDNCAEYDKKVEKVTNFKYKWQEHRKSLRMLIDHQDIHKIDGALVEIESILENNSDNAQVSTNFALLKLYIKDIQDERTFISENIL